MAADLCRKMKVGSAREVNELMECRLLPRSCAIPSSSLSVSYCGCINLCLTRIMVPHVSSAY